MHPFRLPLMYYLRHIAHIRIYRIHRVLNKIKYALTIRYEPYMVHCAFSLQNY